jgi:hypothetical protein
MIVVADPERRREWLSRGKGKAVERKECRRGWMSRPKTVGGVVGRGKPDQLAAPRAAPCLTPSLTPSVLDLCDAPPGSLLRRCG